MVDTYTITFTDGTTTNFTVTNGAQGVQGIQGEKGEDGHTPVITIQNGNWYINGVDSYQAAQGVKGETGNGIASIAKTDTNGLVDTYTITFTDGTTTNFTVTNGAQGIQGIQGEKGDKGDKGEDGHTPIITIQNGNWYIDGVDTGVSAVGGSGSTGEMGVVGETGNGISDIRLTNTVGLVDTYTITYTNGNTTTFEVTNGAQGIQGIQGVAGREVLLQITQTHIQWKYNENDEWKDLISLHELRGSKWFADEGSPVNIDGAKIGDFYLDSLTSEVYELTEDGWQVVANIKGISIRNIEIAYVYDEQGNYVCRYIISLTDGSQTVIDVKEPRKILEIKEEKFDVRASNSPVILPEIKFTVVWSDGTIERIKLENYMIVNVHQVTLSVVGSYRVFVNYCGAYGYITVNVYNDSTLAATEESYLSYDAFVNYGIEFNLEAITFIADYTNPYMAMREVSLSDENVKIVSLRLADGKLDTGYYKIQNGVLMRGKSQYDTLSNPVNTLRGTTFTITIEYLGVQRELKCKWLSSETELLSAKVRMMEYDGGPIYWETTVESFADVDFSLYGKLVFQLEFNNFKGYYVRTLQHATDTIIDIDSQQPINPERTSNNQNLYCEIQATILPGVTTRMYVTYDIVPVVILASNVNLKSASFSEKSVLSTTGVPDLDVTFTIDAAPYQITVPLTAEMLNYNGSNYGFHGDTSTGTRTIYVRYNYYGQIFNIGIPIKIVDPNEHKGGGSLNSGSRYHTATAVQTDYRTMKSPQAIPEIYVKIDYIYLHQLIGINGAQTTEVLHTETILLTPDMITNLPLLDFSKPGTKVIEFYYYGYKSITLEFYNVYNTVIKEINTIEDDISIEKYGDLLAVLKEKYLNQTFTIVYHENYEHAASSTFIMTETLIEECFDLSTFKADSVGYQQITFTYGTTELGTYTKSIVVQVAPIEEEGVSYTVEGGQIGPYTTDTIIVFRDDNILYLTGENGALTYYHLEDTPEGEVIFVPKGNADELKIDMDTDVPVQYWPMTWEEILNEMDAVYLLDHTNYTVKLYAHVSDDAERYKLDISLMDDSEDAGSYVVVDGDVVTLHLIQLNDQGETVEDVLSINAQWNEDKTALTPTNYNQIEGLLIYLALMEDGETLKACLGRYDGVVYTVDCNGITSAFDAGESLVALCPDGICYPVNGEFVTIEMLATYQYCGEKDGKPIAIIYDGENNLQQFYVVIDTDNMIITLYADAYQIDFTEYEESLKANNPDYNYEVSGSVNLLPNGEGFITMSLAQYDADGNQVSFSSETNALIEFYAMDENTLQYRIVDDYGPLYNLNNGAYHFVRTENGLKLTAESYEELYLVDYTDFKAIPAGVLVTKAELKLDANSRYATLIVYADNIVYDSETGTYGPGQTQFELEYQFIKELNAIVATDGENGLTYIFAFNNTQAPEGYAGIVSLLNGIEGEKYTLNMEMAKMILQIQGDNVSFTESYLYVDEENAYASIFVRMKLYDSYGSYEEQILIFVFRYTLENDMIVPVENIADMPIAFKPSAENAKEYEIFLGGTGDIVGMYYSERYGMLVLYANGYCQTQEPIFEILDLTLPCCYKFIGDDGIYITTLLLSAGKTFRIIDGFVVQEDYSYLTSLEHLETISFMFTEYSITMYIDQTTGNGYSAITGANQEGTAMITNVTRIGEDFYKVGFLLGVDLLVKIHEDGSLTLIPASYLD